MLELTEIMKLIHQMDDTALAIETKEADLAAAKEIYRRLNEELIPDALMEQGLTELKLTDGTVVSYDKAYYASLATSDKNPDAVARKEQALAWLKTNGCEDLIKEMVKVNFGRSELDRVNALLVEQFLAKQEIDYKKDETVHPQTLKAFVKERIEGGKPLPLELFAVRIVNETKVKKPKQTKQAK